MRRDPVGNCSSGTWRWEALSRGQHSGLLQPGAEIFLYRGEVVKPVSGESQCGVPKNGKKRPRPSESTHSLCVETEQNTTERFTSPSRRVGTLRSSPPQSYSITPWIKAFHQGQEKKATAIVLVAASEPADGTIFLSDAGCIIAESATLLDTTSEGNPQRAAAAG